MTPCQSAHWRRPALPSRGLSGRRGFRTASLSLAIAALSGCSTPFASAPTEQPAPPHRSTIEYAQVGGSTLTADAWVPTATDPAALRPAIIFFFGGGWNDGTTAQFAPHCERLAAEGIVALSAEYRVKNRDGATPFDCVADGRAAIRWLHEHADEFAIDPARIFASGGSAGGHVAACAVLSQPLPEEAVHHPSPPAITGLVLFNPVIDTSVDGYGHDRLGDRWAEISPTHLVRPGTPPTLIFHGTADSTVHYPLVAAFRDAMVRAGNACELVPFDGRSHGFFNANRGNGADFETTLERTLEFIRSTPSRAGGGSPLL